ncbi:DUF6207 family protein [Streptomyces sp. NPDC007851]|uniref:DUF6207 family protein n=1 Tax=Streptomyces sp. NPDC007851 TaxID=3155008 RepID=UPI00340C6CD2
MPGLAVVEVAAADDRTAFAIQELLTARCAIAPADRTTREPGEPVYGCAASWTCVRSPTRSAAGDGHASLTSRGLPGRRAAGLQRPADQFGVAPVGCGPGWPRSGPWTRRRSSCSSSRCIRSACRRR